MDLKEKLISVLETSDIEDKGVLNAPNSRQFATGGLKIGQAKK